MGSFYPEYSASPELRNSLSTFAVPVWPCGRSMLVQYHDHYNSHGDGSDTADTVTDTAAERQQLDIDELSEM